MSYETILSCPNCGLEHRLVADNVVEDLDNLRKTLRWIEDPSYVGNYDAERIVRIYRQWAAKALGAEGS